MRFFRNKPSSPFRMLQQFAEINGWIRRRWGASQPSRTISTSRLWRDKSSLIRHLDRKFTPTLLFQMYDISQTIQNTRFYFLEYHQIHLMIGRFEFFSPIPVPVPEHYNIIITLYLLNYIINYMIKSVHSLNYSKN